jgi:2-beta-glucuronyltransferase
MKRVVFVTSNYLESPRKAGFHWLAEAFWRAGWEVLFFTESISWLSLLRRCQPRSQNLAWRDAQRLRWVRERMASYVWLTPFHPINLRLSVFNHLSKVVLGLYPRFALGTAKRMITRADLFVFDSDHGLFLFDRFKELNPGARCVYRVSDDTRMMRHNPLLPAQEERIVPQFDLISVPSAVLRKRFGHLPNVFLHRHGLEKSLFDQRRASPYQTPRPNVLFVGKHYFDADFMVRAARLFPSWWFYVFGAVGHLLPASNLIVYGERPFAALVPYLQHADVGLQNLTYLPGAECFTDSLKMLQYTYCRLPIVAPSFLRHERRHVFYYEPGNDTSIREALLAARGCDRTSISTAGIMTWDELAAKLAA